MVYLEANVSHCHLFPLIHAASHVRGNCIGVSLLLTRNAPESDKPRAEERLLLPSGAEVTILFSVPWGSGRDVHYIHQVYMEDTNHKTVQG